ncbi:RNA polymerase II mediator complex subunit [Podochytrium sp. JEL0797]|nr:RNA polymerase II mediator complex subunit [Podochytrium sp. JEL0797]
MPAMESTPQPPQQPQQYQPPPPDSTKSLASLEKNIMRTIDTLFKISATTFDYQPDSAPVLHKRINRLTTNLQDVDSAAQQVHMNVPMSAIELSQLSHVSSYDGYRCIESGGNPDTYTKDMTQVLVDKNQKTNGIITSVKNLHDQLAEEIRKNYPELHEEYVAAIRDGAK